MNISDRELAVRFRERLQAALGEAFLGLKVFGSRARGICRSDSDLDLAVLVARADWDTRRAVACLAADQMLEDDSGITLSPLVLDPERLERLRKAERLLVRDLDRDGIEI